VIRAQGHVYEVKDGRYGRNLQPKQLTRIHAYTHINSKNNWVIEFARNSILIFPRALTAYNLHFVLQPHRFRIFPIEALQELWKFSWPITRSAPLPLPKLIDGVSVSAFCARIAN
jgi:hypothetical protein